MSKTIKKVLAGMLFACAMAVVLPVGHLVSMAASAKITFSGSDFLRRCLSPTKMPAIIEKNDE